MKKFFLVLTLIVLIGSVVPSVYAQDPAPQSLCPDYLIIDYHVYTMDGLEQWDSGEVFCRHIDAGGTRVLTSLADIAPAVLLAHLLPCWEPISTDFDAEFVVMTQYGVQGYCVHNTRSRPYIIAKPDMATLLARRVVSVNRQQNPVGQSMYSVFVDLALPTWARYHGTASDRCFSMPFTGCLGIDDSGIYLNFAGGQYNIVTVDINWASQG